eukprot:TRINITY_DN11895_c0_g1_i1.p1 TRINITY_DN11895_c0_g1~~TRINITY_DN11895_c0_g1_i1.p1  ORF type:complete len:324 (+),score=49.43 TRINITY_DN11895_c0_g1_i1:782-1753(+)
MQQMPSGLPTPGTPSASGREDVQQAQALQVLDAPLSPSVRDAQSKVKKSPASRISKLISVVAAMPGMEQLPQSAITVTRSESFFRAAGSTSAPAPAPQAPLPIEHHQSVTLRQQRAQPEVSDAASMAAEDGKGLRRGWSACAVGPAPGRLIQPCEVSRRATCDVALCPPGHPFDAGHPERPWPLCEEKWTRGEISAQRLRDSQVSIQFSQDAADNRSQPITLRGQLMPRPEPAHEAPSAQACSEMPQSFASSSLSSSEHFVFMLSQDAAPEKMVKATTLPSEQSRRSATSASALLLLIKRLCPTSIIKESQSSSNTWSKKMRS